jgi:hypothetical protein
MDWLETRLFVWITTESGEVEGRTFLAKPKVTSWLEFWMATLLRDMKLTGAT